MKTIRLDCPTCEASLPGVLVAEALLYRCRQDPPHGRSRASLRFPCPVCREERELPVIMHQSVSRLVSAGIRQVWWSLPDEATDPARSSKLTLTNDEVLDALLDMDVLMNDLLLDLPPELRTS